MRALKVFGLILMVLVIVWVNSLKNEKVRDKEENPAPKEVSAITSLTEASNLDGTKHLAGTSELVDGKVFYNFMISDTKKGDKILLFETVAEKSTAITIPFNSWSSDDKKVYLQVNSLEGKTYYVFNSDGSSYSDGKKFLDVQEYWKSAKIDRLVDHVSGWAGPDLLVTYATKPDGTDSFAYWFVISSRKFMQVREL